MNIKIDTLPEIIAAGILCLMALIIVIRAAGRLSRSILEASKRGTKTKLGPLEVVSEAPAPPLCAPIEEHSLLLEELKSAMSMLAPVVRGIDEMQRAQSQALDVLLGIAEGEKINGQVKKARLGLATADGYKAATADVAGGRE
jgi:hypothetical protein